MSFFLVEAVSPIKRPSTSLALHHRALSHCFDANISLFGSATFPGLGINTSRVSKAIG